MKTCQGVMAMKGVEGRPSSFMSGPLFQKNPFGKIFRRRPVPNRKPVMGSVRKQAKDQIIPPVSLPHRIPMQSILSQSVHNYPAFHTSPPPVIPQQSCLPQTFQRRGYEFSGIKLAPLREGWESRHSLGAEQESGDMVEAASILEGFGL